MRILRRGSRWFIPAGVQPLELPGADTASRDRRVRAAHRLTRQVALHKTRRKALIRRVMPMSPLPGSITEADLAVLIARSGVILPAPNGCGLSRYGVPNSRRAATANASTAAASGGGSDSNIATWSFGPCAPSRSMSARSTG